MDFITGFNRDQLVMMDFESEVEPDSWARIVDILPLAELGFEDIPNDGGRPLIVSPICSSSISTDIRTDCVPRANSNTPAK